MRRPGWALGLALACASGDAAADAVIYDDERYREVKTEIEVRGVDGLGDVALVVYPYPCALSGPFAAYEEQESGSTLELEARDDEESRGYLVVAEGERFPSTSDYEGPYIHCYFFGLPRAAFPVEGKAIPRLDAMTQDELWQTFSRDPSLLRTGVPLAMDGLVTGLREQNRLVTYEARREGEALKVEAVRWTWTLTGGKTRSQDPRALSAAALAAFEPHADRSDDEEAPFFAGSLVRKPSRAPGKAAAEDSASTGPSAAADTQGAEPSADNSASTGLSAETGAGAAESANSASTGPAPAAEAGPAARTTDPPAATEAAPAQGAAAGAAPTVRPAATDPKWVYGGACLIVAAVAGLLLWRGRE